MPLLPFLGIIELALKLVILLLEGVPPEQRRAQALQWFWTWWPLQRLFLNEEQRKTIESIMKGATTEQ